MDHETSSITFGKFYDKALSRIRVCIYDGILKNSPMEVDVKENAYISSKEKLKTLLEISKDTSQDVHKLTKEVTLIKKHVLGKEMTNFDNKT